MDQEARAGHPVITRAAVHELFTSVPTDPDGKISGLTEAEYAKALVAAQKVQDRLTGPTSHPAWLNGPAQAEHALADPFLTGAENLERNRQYVERATMAAQASLRSHDREQQFAHLGRAVHALQDSYSEAHAWRQAAVNAGDPTAPIESFNVFDPVPDAIPGNPGWRPGGNAVEGTHLEAFDHVPVDQSGNLIRGTDKAAAHAVARLLINHHNFARLSDGNAERAIRDTLGSFFRPSPSGVTVTMNPQDPLWTANAKARMATHQTEVNDSISGWQINLHVDTSTPGRGIDYWPLGVRLTGTGLRVGHAWVTLDGPSGEHVAAGYYPTNPNSPVGPGEIHLDDQSHASSEDIGYRWSITPEAAASAMRYIQAVEATPGTYYAINHNCVTFAGDLLSAAGIDAVNQVLTAHHDFLTADVHDPALLVATLHGTSEGAAAALRYHLPEPQLPADGQPVPVEDLPLAPGSELNPMPVENLPGVLGTDLYPMPIGDLPTIPDTDMATATVDGSQYEQTPHQSPDPFAPADGSYDQAPDMPEPMTSGADVDAGAL